MIGWGGNIVQLMPNGMIGFRIGSVGSTDVEQMMLIANKQGMGERSLFAELNERANGRYGAD